MEETIERPDRFRKVKDLVQNFKTNETVKTVQSHFEENKKFYFGAAVGVASCLIIVKRRAPVIAPVFNNTINNANNANIANTVNNGGPMYKIVQDVDHPELIWQKLKYLAEDIAKEHGISVDSARVRLRNQMNGISDDLYGHRYAIIGHGPSL